MILLEDLAPSGHLSLLPRQELHILVPFGGSDLGVSLPSQFIRERSRVLTEVYVAADSGMRKKTYSWVGVWLPLEFGVRLWLKAHSKEVHIYYYISELAFIR